MTLDQHRRGVALAEALEAAAVAYKDHQQSTRGCHAESVETICRKARYSAMIEHNLLAQEEARITLRGSTP